MLKRTIEDKIEKYLTGKDYKTFYIRGPRRSGKTTILRELSPFRFNPPKGESKHFVF